jgi:hypothetical protein
LKCQDLLLVVEIYIDAVTPHRKQPLWAVLHNCRVNPGRRAGAMANRVSDRILKKLL